MKKQFIISLFSVLLVACGDDPVLNPIESLSSNFTQSPSKNQIKTKSLPEISGVAASQTMNGYLWVNQDSDNEIDLALIDTQGGVIKTFELKKRILNRDWEDIAVGVGPVENKSYVYIGDIGDNNKSYATKYIHRFEEIDNANTEIGKIETIAFVYPNDEKYDAEGLILDPLTKDIYVFTKQISISKVFKLAYPQKTQGINTAEFIGTVPVNFATGATISPDGREIIVRSYFDIQYWQRLNKEPLTDIFKKVSKSLPYLGEPQGEGVSFDKKGTGYYTISELGGGTEQYLYFYKRQ